MNLDALNGAVLGVAQSIGTLAKNLPTQITRIGNSMFIATVADVETTEVADAVDILVVTGYSAAGDGGGGTYVRTDTATGPGVLTSSDGAHWIFFAGGGFVTPRQFGAVVDGATDDSTAFQDAIDFAVDDGGAVFVPAGTYAVNGLTNADGVAIIGEGAGLAILLVGAAGLTNNSAGLVLSGLTLQTATAAAVIVDIAIGTLATNVRIEGCSFIGISDTTCIRILGGSGIRIANNQFLTMDIAIKGFFGGSSDGLFILGNQINGAVTAGIEFTTPGVTLKNVIISNNEFFDCAAAVSIPSQTAWVSNIIAADNTWTGSAGGQTAFSLNACTGFQVIGNTVTSGGAGTNLFEADNTSNIGVVGGNTRNGTFAADVVTATNVLFNVDVGLGVNGTKVVGTQRTGWNPPTATPLRGTLATGATLPTTVSTLAALILDLQAHGLIDS